MTILRGVYYPYNYVHAYVCSAYICIPNTITYTYTYLTISALDTLVDKSLTLLLHATLSEIAKKTLLT